MSVQNILQEICRELDLPSQEFSQENPLVLNFDEAIEITFTPDGEVLVLAARVRPVDELRREELIDLLKGNAQGELGESLALDSQNGYLVLVRRIPNIDSVQALTELTEDFIKSLSKWMERMGQGVKNDSAPASAPQEAVFDPSTMIPV